MTATAVRPQTPANRRMMLIALIVISAFNYVDRTILSILQIPIKAELGLSDGQLGALTGLAFALFYATLSLPIARLADRYSRRWIIVISLVVWSAMTAMCGFATGFVSLLFFRVGVAIGEAGSVPASVSLIADSYAPERRATAMSTWGLALPIGLMIGYVCTGWLAEHLGWRLAFAVVGGVGVLLGPIVFAMIKEPARGRFEAGSAQGIVEPPPPLAQALRALWDNKVFRYTVAAGMLHGFSQYSMMTWNAPFFTRSHGMTLGEVSLLMALLSGVAGAVGIYGGGWLSDRLVARDPRGRLWLKAGSVAAVVPFALVQYLAPSTTVSIVAAAITSAMMIAYYGPILATTQSVVAPTMRAFSNAVLLLTFNLFGLGLGPWVTGLLSDALTGTFGDQALRYALAIVLIPSALATLTFLFAARFQSTDGVAASPAGVTDHA
jgi:predicted MFS family arabinose efflux permease